MGAWISPTLPSANQFLVLSFTIVRVSYQLYLGDEALTQPISQPLSFKGFRGLHVGKIT